MQKPPLNRRSTADKAAAMKTTAAQKSTPLKTPVSSQRAARDEKPVLNRNPLAPTADDKTPPVEALRSGLRSGLRSHPLPSSPKHPPHPRTERAGRVEPLPLPPLRVLGNARLLRRYHRLRLRLILSSPLQTGSYIDGGGGLRELYCLIRPTN
jgi:hypothetical protein